MAAKHGDPDLWLSESWIPAVPGLNVRGDYWQHYARDPLSWVKAELNICRNWHHLFMPMVGADPKFCHDNADFWLTGGGVTDLRGAHPHAHAHAGHVHGGDCCG